MASGNHFQREVDMPALPGVLGLELVRHYNSDAAFGDERGLFGRGWRLSYEEQLLVNRGGNSLTAILGDGTRRRFFRGFIQPVPGTTLYLPSQRDQAPLRALHSPAGTEYRLDVGGNAHVFDSQRRLVRIEAPTGEALTLHRDHLGALVRVTDPQGRSLEFGHLGARDRAGGKRFPGIQQVDSPVGRFRYTYGSAPPGAADELQQQAMSNLVGVALPSRFERRTGPPALGAESNGITTSTVSRIYHYEDARQPGLLTGISVQGQGSDGRRMDERLATWAHDRHGRAVLSVRSRYDPARPGIEQVTLRYARTSARGGVTILTNSLGQETSYTHGEILGERQVLEVRGAGCASCGPVNVRYQYDARGLLVQVIALDRKGEPLSAQVMEYDGVHRPIRLGTLQYVKGRPGEPRWTMRYRYGPDIENRQPVLVVRPSVVAGQEHRIAITYNDAGQPLEVTESGFSPVDENGAMVPAGVPITRTIRYTYARVRGRSLLVAIDGPLPNGPRSAPEDSDVTRVGWDAAGNHIVAVERPMGLRRQMARDPWTGRVTELMDETGAVTRYGYGNPRMGRPDTIEQGKRVVRFEFDALDQVSRISDGIGRAIRMGRDNAGHTVSVQDAQGYAVRSTLDTEGQPRVTALYEPHQDKPLRASYRWYDPAQRATHQLLPDGWLDSWIHGEDGRTTIHVDGENLAHLDLDDGAEALHLDLSPHGWVRATLPAPATPACDLDDVCSDDFGRTVRAAARGQGTRVFVYGAFEMPTDVRLFDPNGRLHGTIYTDYDAAGRVLRKTSSDAAGKPLSWTRRVYAGPWLIAEEDEVQVTGYTYDSQGHLTGTRLGFKDEAGRTALELHTATAYDPRTDEAASLVLADGRTLHLTRHAVTGMVARAELQSAFWSRLGQWLPEVVQAWLPKETLLTEVRFHPFNGITDVVLGNGLHTTRRFDLAGRLLAITTPGVQDEHIAYGAVPRVLRVQDAAAGGRQTDSRYTYGRFGMLEATPPVALNTAAHAEPPLQKDARGRYTSDGRLRYTYTLDGQIETVSTHDGKRIASYRYNSAHQRVSKTVHAADGTSRTAYFLWQAGRIAAEIEGTGTHAGEVTAQYIYLSDGQRTTPIAKLEGAHAVGNATAAARTLFIHSNHRAEPVAMTDAAQRVVWRGHSDAQGQLTVASAAAPGAVLNLRLPGQYHDVETGLHDNWHRSYDPRSDSPLRGRYLSPDPIGYPDGPDPYLYAQGDPINRSDPTGLYEIDVHYYLTLFLALAAGVEKEDARIIALATQYIDDNPQTRPTEPGGGLAYVHSGFINQEALRTYHFTQYGYDRPRSASEQAYWDRNHLEDPLYVARRTVNPSNPQLDRLMGAVNRAPDRCARLQFFGEYLHAFEDTFAHRGRMNDPYQATVLDYGLGHGAALHDADYTYNHATWNNNYSRTIEMEKEVFEKMARFAKPGARRMEWRDIAETMVQFTSFPADEKSPKLGAKIDILAKRILALNFQQTCGFSKAMIGTESRPRLLVGVTSLALSSKMTTLEPSCRPMPGAPAMHQQVDKDD